MRDKGKLRKEGDEEHLKDFGGRSFEQVRVARSEDEAESAAYSSVRFREVEIIIGNQGGGRRVARNNGRKCENS